MEPDSTSGGGLDLRPVGLHYVAMSDRLLRRFPGEQRAAVTAAVRAAEARTGGELVVVVVERSDGYAQAAWKAATLGALGAALIAAAIHARLGLWGLGWVWTALPAVAGAALGYLAAHFSEGLRRWLLAPQVLEARVQARAAQAFRSEGVGRTSDRMGVLVLVSLFERRAVVLPDLAVGARVAEGDWPAVTDALAAAIAGRGVGPALCESVERLADVLSRHGFAPRPGDGDELGDAVRVEE